MHNYKNCAALYMFLQVSTSSYNLGFALGKSSEISHLSPSWTLPYSDTNIFEAVTPDTSLSTFEELDNQGAVARSNVLPRNLVTKHKCARHSKSRRCRAYRRQQRLNALHKSALLRLAVVTEAANLTSAVTAASNVTSAVTAVSKVTVATGTNTGQATYYGTGLGACGITSNDTSMIAAASHILFDNFPGATANPNLNPICGRKVKATYEGASVVVEIVDRCVGCAEFDLDFSPTAFALIGPMVKGRLSGMTWHWV